MLNSSQDEKIKHVKVENRSSEKVLKIILVVLLVALAAILSYTFFKRQNPPMVAERTELSKYDDKNAEIKEDPHKK